MDIYFSQEMLSVVGGRRTTSKTTTVDLLTAYLLMYRCAV